MTKKELLEALRDPEVKAALVNAIAPELGRELEERIMEAVERSVQGGRLRYMIREDG